MDKFYCIKVIAKNGNRGWVIDTDNGAMITAQIFNATQFKAEPDAKKLIK